jgi:multiple sugar transport system ATP-binding protein
MTMGDRVAVMRKGELQQVDAPQTLYDYPVNLFVGGFIGSPAMNLLEATLERSGDGLVAVLGQQRLTLDPQLVAERKALKGYEGREIVVGIRPEDLEDAALADGAPADRRLRGRVVLREALGSELMVHLNVEARPAVTDEVRELAADVGAGVPQTGHPEATVVGRFSARSDVREGANVEAAVDTSVLHFFDPQTGLGIYADEAKGAGT